MRLAKLVRSVRRALGDTDLVVEWSDDGRRCRQQDGEQPRARRHHQAETWVACEEHRASLSEFLDRRSFLKRVDPLEGVSDS